MLLLPVKFDQNEWFVLLNCLLGYTWMFFAPKRYPRAITVLVIFFTVTIAIIMDHTLAAPPLDMYDLNDRKEYEITDFLTYFMYTPYAVLSVYLYDRFNPKGQFFTAYIILWSLLCVSFEWLAVYFTVFKYNGGWKLLYSFCFYLVASPLHFTFFVSIRRYFRKTSNGTVTTGRF